MTHPLQCHTYGHNVHLALTGTRYLFNSLINHTNTPSLFFRNCRVTFGLRYQMALTVNKPLR
ncbi:hypothetical protein VPHK436_0007 [Vibrio phage K436]